MSDSPAADPLPDAPPVLLAPITQRLIASTALAAICVLLVCSTWSLSRSRELHDDYRLDLDLNTASAVELQLVPGVGEVTARRIVQARVRLGRFESFDDVLAIKGIGPKTIAELVKYCVEPKPMAEDSLLANAEKNVGTHPVRTNP
ncbi:MAG: helix-hairpin-helix domain-containing protein [Planctomycetota bacterium]